MHYVAYDSRANRNMYADIFAAATSLSSDLCDSPIRSLTGELSLSCARPAGDG